MSKQLMSMPLNEILNVGENNQRILGLKKGSVLTLGDYIHLKKENEGMKKLIQKIKAKVVLS